MKGNSKNLQLMVAHLEKHQPPEPFVSTAADDAEFLKYAALAIAAPKEDNDGTT